eukprot:PhM_4_TR10217/c0_g1_i2/m.92969
MSMSRDDRKAFLKQAIQSEARQPAYARATESWKNRGLSPAAGPEPSSPRSNNNNNNTALNNTSISITSSFRDNSPRRLFSANSSVAAAFTEGQPKKQPIIPSSPQPPQLGRHYTGIPDVIDSPTASGGGNTPRSLPATPSPSNRGMTTTGGHILPQGPPEPTPTRRALSPSRSHMLRTNSGVSAKQCLQPGNVGPSGTHVDAEPAVTSYRRVRSFAAPPDVSQPSPTRRHTPQKERDLFKCSDSDASRLLLPYTQWLQQRSMSRRKQGDDDTRCNNDSICSNTTLQPALEERATARRHYSQNEKSSVALVESLRGVTEEVDVSAVPAGHMLLHSDRTDSSLMGVRARRTYSPGVAAAQPARPGLRVYNSPETTTLLDDSKKPSKSTNEHTSGRRCSPSSRPVERMDKTFALKESLVPVLESPRGRAAASACEPPDLPRRYSPHRRQFARHDSDLFSSQQQPTSVSSPGLSSPRSGRAVGTYSPSRRNASNVITWGS